MTVFQDLKDLKKKVMMKHVEFKERQQRETFGRDTNPETPELPNRILVPNFIKSNKI